MQHHLNFRISYFNEKRDIDEIVRTILVCDPRPDVDRHKLSMGSNDRGILCTVSAWRFIPLILLCHVPFYRLEVIQLTPESEFYPPKRCSLHH